MPRNVLEISAELEQLIQSPTAEIYRQVEALRLSFYVVEANLAELKQLTGVLDEPEVAQELWKKSNQHTLDALTKECCRRVHNFLASAKSLVDHTRVSIKRLLNGKDFLSEYEAKLNEELANNKTQKFIQELRNYTQHYQLPVVFACLGYAPDTGTYSAFKLDIKKLKLYNKWTSLSQEYLDNLYENISVNVLADEYFHLIQNFYLWLNERLEEIYGQEFKRLNQRVEELKQEMRDVVERTS